MKGLKYQLKSIFRDKFCLMTFLLPILVAMALNFMDSIDLSPQGEFHFGILENDLSPQVLLWLEQYGSVEHFDTMEELTAAINEPSTVVIGVRADGQSIRTIISGDELDIFRQAASDFPALYEQRETARRTEIQVLKQPDVLAGFQDMFIALTLIVAMFMGCTFNAMNMVSEKEDGITFVNEILPMTPGQYIIQKITVGFLCGCLSSVVTACICYRLSWQSTGGMFALIVLSSFVAALFGLFIGRFSDGLMAGVVYIKIVMLLFIAVPIACTLIGVSGLPALLCYLVPSRPALEGIMALSSGNAQTALKDAGILTIHCAAWFVLYILISLRKHRHV